MVRILKLLLFLFTIYYVMQIIFLFLGPGYKLSYEIKKDDKRFLVKESYHKYSSKDLTNYYIEISTNNLVYNYQIIGQKNVGQKIITDIKYYEDNDYQCILPLFKGVKIEYDITCFHDQKQDYYYNLKNRNTGLDNFVKSLKEYDSSKFINNEENFKEDNNMLLYSNNTISGYNLAVTMRKSVYTSTDDFNKFTRTDFFSPSAIIPPTTPIRTFIKNYIVIADYSMKDNFNRFILVNRDGNNKSLFETPSLSFNSYIQGVVGDSFYLIDKDAKKQYKINIKERTAFVVGTLTSQSVYYNNGVWEKRNLKDALEKDLSFNEYVTDVTNDFNGYDKVIKYGGENSGYYYYFKNNNKKYDVYFSHVQNKDNIIYLFTASMDDMKFADDYLYFIDNNTIKYYNHRTGLHTLVGSKTETIIDYNIYYEK